MKNSFRWQTLDDARLAVEFFLGLKTSAKTYDIELFSVDNYSREAATRLLEEGNQLAMERASIYRNRIQEAIVEDCRFSDRFFLPRVDSDRIKFSDYVEALLTTGYFVTDLSSVSHLSCIDDAIINYKLQLETAFRLAGDLVAEKLKSHAIDFTESSFTEIGQDGDSNFLPLFSATPFFATRSNNHSDGGREERKRRADFFFTDKRIRIAISEASNNLQGCRIP